MFSWPKVIPGSAAVRPSYMLQIVSLTPDFQSKALLRLLQVRATDGSLEVGQLVGVTVAI